MRIGSEVEGGTGRYMYCAHKDDFFSTWIERTYLLYGQGRVKASGHVPFQSFHRPPGVDAPDIELRQRRRYGTAAKETLLIAVRTNVPTCFQNIYM